MTVIVENTDAPVGAVISDLNIAAPLEAGSVAAVERAFLNRGVLLFRDQPLDVHQLVRFSANFGTLQPHVQRAYQHPDAPEIVVMSNVDKEGRFNEAGARRGAAENLREGWHSDLSYDPIPAKATLLHSQEIPSHGGNTCFADTASAYAALPDSLKLRLSGRLAEFQYGGHSRNKLTGLAASTLDQNSQTIATHPVICAHPQTGIPAIYANPLMATRILGVPAAESEALLEELFDWIDRPEFRWEHEWRIGDTLMWENRGGVMHSGRLNYPRNERRIFIRTTVRGEAIKQHRPA
ncbi:MAG: taurine dioxygenase [Alphaproteobacteria bacterium]|jgi:taurine dioxygenase